MPCFGSGNPSVAPSLGRFQNDDMTSKYEPIEVSDEEEQLVGVEPQNPEEARSYREKVDMVFDTFGETSHRGCQGCPSEDGHITQEGHGEALGWYGRGGCEQCSEDHQRSLLSPPLSVSSDRWH